MTTISINNVPAKEAIAHFRQKVQVPTQRWDQLMGAANAHAFTVAGATKADLLNDLYESVLSAIEDGESIGQFRKRFDKIVEGHGWQYKGKRGWRTRVIYDNNLRTAKMAGRWQQIQRTKATRPYLIYTTVGDSQVRDEHRKWDKLVLPVDDSFWDTHYPPNGWNCRCTIRTANDRQLEREGLSLSTPPEVENTERTNHNTGEYFGKHPKGIDTGWGYNVGKAWLGPDISLGNKLAALPTPLREAGLSNIANQQSARLESWKVWLKDRAKDDKSRGHQFTIGHMSAALFNTVMKVKRPQSTALVVSDKQLSHLVGNHKDKSKRFPPDWLNDLPTKLLGYQAILEHKGNIVIVLPDKVGDRNGRAVVTIDYKQKGQVFNSVRSLGIVQLSSLKRSEYTLLEGEL